MADVASALKDAETKMNKAVEVAKDDFATVRTGRAHPSIFNKVMVDYYGTYTALSQLASIQVPEARMAIISPLCLHPPVYRKQSTILLSPLTWQINIVRSFLWLWMVISDR